MNVILHTSGEQHRLVAGFAIVVLALATLAAIGSYLLIALSTLD